MILRLVREPTIDGSTHGVLFVDGHFQCFTMEDAIREQLGVPVSQWKIPAQTAIPAGRYRITITPSVRFKKRLPLLHDVPGFTGIRMHTGNSHVDSEGCLLVGKDRAPGKVLQSRVAFAALFEKLDAAGDVWIEIENPRA